jgi:hypothetical protein
LCVTPLRYAQTHGFSRWSSIYRRRTFRISSCGKYLLSRRVSQTILMARSDRPSGCRWPAIRRVALQAREIRLRAERSRSSHLMRDLGRCGSGGDRSKPSDPFLARTADPIPLSIQGVKRATAPQARTPEDAGRRGDRCSGCANAYDVDWKQLVIQRLCGFCAAPRNGGGDRVPIELPAGGAPLLHCREKRGLLRRSPGTSVLIHNDGSLSDTEENRVASWPGSALSKKEPSRRSVFIWRLGGRRPLARA